jgi:hypothetical protein
MFIGLLILVVLIALPIFLYNRLVSLRVRAQNAWSDIDVQLKRRADRPQPGRDGERLRWPRARYSRGGNSGQNKSRSRAERRSGATRSGRE